MRRSKNKSASKAKADRYFSLYVRYRDADDMGYADCITCGKTLFIKEAHCGHFVLRDRLKTRYDERNGNFQCIVCNMHRAGEQYLHGKNIDDKYGEGTADKLIALGKEIVKMTQSDYEAIAKTYKELYEEQKKLKHL